MTVADLIEILNTQDPRARVVLYDHTASVQPAVSSLGVAEVRPIALRGEEEFGVVWLKVAEQGPANAVVLGPQYPCSSPVDERPDGSYESLKVQTLEEFFEEFAAAVEGRRTGRRTTPLSTLSFESEEAKQAWIARQKASQNAASSDGSLSPAPSVGEMSRAELEALIQEGEDSGMTEMLRQLMVFAERHGNLAEPEVPLHQGEVRPDDSGAGGETLLPGKTGGVQQTRHESTQEIGDSRVLRELAGSTAELKRYGLVSDADSVRMHELTKSGGGSLDVAPSTSETTAADLEARSPDSEESGATPVRWEMPDSAEERAKPSGPDVTSRRREVRIIAFAVVSTLVAVAIVSGVITLLYDVFKRL